MNTSYFMVVLINHSARLIMYLSTDDVSWGINSGDSQVFATVESAESAVERVRGILQLDLDSEIKIVRVTYEQVRSYTFKSAVTP
jgi:hypothetical protein